VASLTIIWCLTATAADAIIVEYPSIEWLCDSSPHIGIAWACIAQGDGERLLIPVSGEDDRWQRVACCFVRSTR